MENEEIRYKIGQILHIAYNRGSYYSDFKALITNIEPNSKGHEIYYKVLSGTMDDYFKNSNSFPTKCILDSEIFIKILGQSNEFTVKVLYGK